MKVTYDGDNLHVTAPTLHFLTGAPLNRLKDGASVAYVAQLELLDDSRSSVLRPQKGRFVVSYALWEETFSVTHLGSTPGSPPRSAEGLSLGAAEAWCFDNLTMSTLGLSPTVYYWLRLALRTGTERDFADEGKIGISIHDLIGMLGHKNTEITHWGPLETRVRLADLPRMAAGRGSRIG